MKDLLETNPHLAELDLDWLYHLGFNSKDELVRTFSDVRHVVMHGAPHRADEFAHSANRELQLGLPDEEIQAIGSRDRFSLYKIGDIVSVSHGIGQPSHSTLLHEITKLLWHAGVRDVAYFRLGTSGGIGVVPGTVVISDKGVDPSGEAKYQLHRLGEVRDIGPTTFNDDLIQDILDVRGDIETVLGSTSANNDFHYEQARTDGAFCDFTREQQQAYLHRMYEIGVRNFEMEAAGFAAFCNRLGIPAACMCVALLNRFEGDQVDLDAATYADFCSRPQRLMIQYLKKRRECA